MACQALHRDELVEKYLNGQMLASARDEFEVHLLECADCQQSVDALHALRHELTEAAHRIRAHHPAGKP